jgi:AcrR family transcriptional regulator
MSAGEATSTRERILAAAIDVMRSKGVAAATTRVIAAEAGISEALIYRYFRSKLDVLRAAVREYVGPRFSETLAQLPAHVDDVTAAANLERVALAALAFYRDLIPVLASLYSDNGLIDWYRSSTRDADAGPHRAVRILGDYLTIAQQHGYIAPDIIPLAAAQMLLGACFQQVFFSQTLGAERMALDDATLAAGVARCLAPAGNAVE